MATALDYVRKVIDPSTRRLRHAGVAAARQAVKQAEARAKMAVANRSEWDKQIAQLIERSRGDMPPIEAMEDLRRHRSQALLLEAQRGSDLADARTALQRVEAKAPSQTQIDEWQAELQDGIDERRRAAELLADPVFANRLREIRTALGDPMGLQALQTAAQHIERQAAEIRRVFTEHNTIAKSWWLEGPDDE